jgi:hypothetical protein
MVSQAHLPPLPANRDLRVPTDRTQEMSKWLFSALLAEPHVLSWAVVAEASEAREALVHRVPLVQLVCLPAAAFSIADAEEVKARGDTQDNQVPLADREETEETGEPWQLLFQKGHKLAQVHLIFLGKVDLQREAVQEVRAEQAGQGELEAEVQLIATVGRTALKERLDQMALMELTV